MEKDYYAILGVTPVAEDIVIRAAYKALAQRYHPDRYSGPKDEATRMMAELNEAYAVLSDPVKRKEYDALRANGAQDGGGYFGDQENESPPGFDPLEKDWAVAVEYYPDLEDILARLRQVSWRLGYAYKAYLLDQKAFNGRQAVAQQFEQQFLQSYFGTNPKILRFARQLIASGHRQG
jgi:curved DNA-binding protein CbpA